MVRLTQQERDEVNDSADKRGVLDSVSSFGTGVVEGVKRDPFVALAMKGLSEIEGADPDGLREMEQYADNSTAAQFGRFVGEYGPTLLFGIPLMGGGAAAGRAAIRGIAEKVATQSAARDALAAAAKAGTRLPRLKEQLTLVSASAAGERAGAEALVQGIPAVQRGAESLGANLAFANLIGAQELARGKPPVEALKTAAISVAIFGAIDTALLGGTKLLFPGSRAVDLVAHRENFLKENLKGKSPVGVRLKEIETIKTRRQEMADEVWDILKVDKQQEELFIAGQSKAARLREVLNPPKRPEKPATLREILREKRAAAADDLAGLSREEGKEARRALTLEARQEATDAKLAFKTELNAVKAKEARFKKVADLMAARNLERSKLRQAESELTFEGTVPYIGSGPAYLGPIQRAFDWLDPDGKLRFGLFSASESAFGKFGNTGNRTLTPLMRAVDRIDKLSKEAEQMYSMWSENLRHLLGEKSSRAWKNGFGKHLDSHHHWELGGPDGLRTYMEGLGRSNKQIEEAISIFEAMENLEFQVLQVQGRQIGAKPALNPADFGLKRYVTHASRDIPDEALAKHLVSEGKMTEAEAREVLAKATEHLDPAPLEGIEATRPGRLGPYDFYRKGKGTYRDKVEKGLPMNPAVLDARLRVLQSAYRRIHIDPILGRRVFNEATHKVEGDRIPALVESVVAEGGNGPKFKTLLDTVAGRTYYNESMRKVATFTTSLQVAAKLPMAVLPNASQPLLTTTMAGIRPSLKSLFKLTDKSTREDIARATAVHEHMIRGLGRTMDQEGLALTSMEKVSDYILRFTQFNRVERFNRIHGAQTAQIVIRDSLAKGYRDKLRGVNLDTARRRLGELGLDFDLSVRQMKEIGPEAFLKSPAFLRQEETAIMRGAQKTQFWPGPTRTPSYWRHPVGRVMLQFKTFAVGQGRFMRDIVLTEYAHGNVAPLATFLAISPIAGELVADAKTLITQKDRTENGLVRALDNASHIGGVGLFSDVFAQAKWGRLESAYLGPTVSDLNDLFEAAISEGGQGIVNLMKRQQIYKVMGFAAGGLAEGAKAVENQLDEYLDASSEEDGSSTTRVDVGQLLTERIRNKGR